MVLYPHTIRKSSLYLWNSGLELQWICLNFPSKIKRMQVNRVQQNVMLYSEFVNPIFSPV